MQSLTLCVFTLAALAHVAAAGNDTNNSTVMATTPTVTPAATPAPAPTVAAACFPRAQVNGTNETTDENGTVTNIVYWTVEGVVCPPTAAPTPAPTVAVTAAVTAATTSGVTAASCLQTCMATPYLSTGQINYFGSFTMSCPNSAGKCTCDSTYEDTCTDYDNGVAYEWCNAKIFGSCPVWCKDTELECSSTPFTTEGFMDPFGSMNFSCVAETTGCPCNAIWENQCTDPETSDKYCDLKAFGSCPVVCAGGGETCWGTEYKADGKPALDMFSMPKMKEFCEVNKTCGCNTTYELDCQMRYGEETWNECMPKYEFSACPTQCTSSQVMCYVENFDTTGAITFGEVCKASMNACMGSGSCGTGSKTCGEGIDAYCIWDKETCPMVCTKKTCFAENFDVTGLMTGYTESCVEMTAKCPCGTKATKCTWTDMFGTMEYCIPATEKCPVQCDFTANKVCLDSKYSSTGEWLSDTETCTKMATACSCTDANAIKCTFSFFGQTEEMCLPKSIEGITQTCPVICKMTEDICVQTDFDADGAVTGFSETCVPFGTPCVGCGKNSRACVMEGEGWTLCLPNKDSVTRAVTKCPVYCNPDTSTQCFTPAFDPFGDLVDFKEVCMSGGNSQTCKCSGSNSKPCTFTWGAMSHTECIPKTPKSASYCPVTCDAGKVTCDPVDNFNKAGDYVGSSDPKKGDTKNPACATGYDKCGCGKLAKRCKFEGISFCMPNAFGACPIQCKATEKKCDIINMDTTGAFKSANERCVNMTQPCPCGKNTERCPGEDFCVTKAEKKMICPCKLSEKVCEVEDYDKEGKQSGQGTKCMPKAKKCTCGKNAQLCEDKLDATNTICVPKNSKDGMAGCPKPCTPADAIMGNSTCIQTNLNDKGKFLSSKESCVAPGKCLPGKGQKKCPTNATISTASKCSDPYNQLSTKARRLAAVGNDKVETATTIFSLGTVTLTTATAAPKTKTVKAALDSALMLSGTLSSTMTIKMPATNTAKTATVTYVISNKGATAVSPKAVQANLKNMIAGSDKKIKEAFKDIGVPKSKPITTQIATKTIVMRTNAPTPVPTTQITLTVGFTVSNVKHATIIADADLKANFTLAMEEAVAEVAGVGIIASHVTATLSASSARRLLDEEDDAPASAEARKLAAGDTSVSAVITPPAGVSANAVDTALNGNKTGLVNAVVARATAVPGIAAATTAGVAIGCSAPVVANSGATAAPTAAATLAATPTPTVATKVNKSTAAATTTALGLDSGAADGAVRSALPTLMPLLSALFAGVLVKFLMM